ncbi:hypothetical protein GH733_019337, partial [Mirounga leonina]
MAHFEQLHGWALAHPQAAHGFCCEARAGAERHLATSEDWVLGKNLEGRLQGGCGRNMKRKQISQRGCAKISTATSKGKGGGHQMNICQGFRNAIQHRAVSFLAVPTTFQRHGSKGWNKQIWLYLTPGLQAASICDKVGTVTIYDYLSYISCTCDFTHEKNSTALSRLVKGSLSTIGSPSPSSRSEILPTSNGMMLVLNIHGVHSSLASLGEDWSSLRKGIIERYDHYLRFISIASCTMNCLAPWSRLFIHVNFGIMERLMITVHTITSTLKNMDCPSRKLWHVGHGASQIIISANTDTAKTVGKVIPELNGSPTGTVFCVFTPSMSPMNLTCTLKKKTNIDILAYTEDQVVSYKFNSDTYSSAFDVWTSTALKGHVVKLIHLYDNKFDYRNHVMDFMVHMACCHSDMYYSGQEEHEVRSAPEEATGKKSIYEIRANFLVQVL